MKDLIGEGDVGEGYLVGAGDILAIWQQQKLKLKVWINSTDPPPGWSNSVVDC